MSALREFVCTATVDAEGEEFSVKVPIWASSAGAAAESFASFRAEHWPDSTCSALNVRRA